MGQPAGSSPAPHPITGTPTDRSRRTASDAVRYRSRTRRTTRCIRLTAALLPITNPRSSRSRDDRSVVRSRQPTRLPAPRGFDRTDRRSMRASPSRRRPRCRPIPWNNPRETPGEPFASLVSYFGVAQKRSRLSHRSRTEPRREERTAALVCSLRCDRLERVRGPAVGSSVVRRIGTVRVRASVVGLVAGRFVTRRRYPTSRCPASRSRTDPRPPRGRRRRRCRPPPLQARGRPSLR